MKYRSMSTERTPGVWCDIKEAYARGASELAAGFAGRSRAPIRVMAQARRIIGGWRIEYSTERPQCSRSNLTPEEFATADSATCKNRVLIAADSNSGRY